MIGGADADSRLRIFDWLTDQRAVHGEGLSHSLLKNCVINGQRVRLMGEQQGNLEAGGVRGSYLRSHHDEQPIP